jgi:hypothetical protein
LDTFCIAHFKEWDDFVRITEKGLLLDKTDFSEKGNKIDKQKFPTTPIRQLRPVAREKRKLMNS